MTTVVIQRTEVKTVVERITNATIEVPRGPRGLPGADGQDGVDGLNGGGHIEPIAFSYGDAAGIIYTPASAGTLTTARVVITTPFDGANPSLVLGTNAAPTSIMAAADSDLSEAGEYELTADKPLNASEGVRLAITPGAGATQGAGLLYLTFIPTE